MSIMDNIDDALLEVDDDELDYDLEKDEEDALLADPDCYDEQYDEEQKENENIDEPFEEPVANEEESDILDIDSNVHLDETEEDFGNQSLQDNSNNDLQTVKPEIDDEDQEVEQKERNRFLNERNSSVQHVLSNEIPDNLDKVTVKKTAQYQNGPRNGRFQRGNRGRGRGRQNINVNRCSVFNRMGNQYSEGKTVLINPHFRGNVQATENARLVWDPNFHQTRYSGPQTVQVAPFHTQPSPWLNPPYSESGNNNFSQPPAQSNYQDPSTQMQYNHPTEIMNTGIRPLMQINQPPPIVPYQQPPPVQNQMTNWCDNQSYNGDTIYPQQGSFRGREVRFTNNATIPPLMMNNPPPNFNQQQNFQGRNNFNFPENQNVPNQNRPYIHQNNPNNPPVMQMQHNYPPPNMQNFDQQHQNFVQQQNQFPQNRMQPSYETYHDQNQFQNHQFQNTVHNNHTFQSQNFQQSVNYDSNFIPNQPIPESFPPKQYHQQFNQSRSNNQQPRHQINNYNNRSPPKRRSFENTIGSGDRDLPKKKKRSMELSNLHEVPTIDMPDTTTVEKEEEDEETKAYRLQIEEQKKLREKILREKEERRKLAAAQKANVSENSEQTGNGSVTNNLTTKPIPVSNQQQKFVIKPQQQSVLKQQQPLIKQQQPLIKQQQQQTLIKQQQQQQQSLIKQQQPLIKQQQPQKIQSLKQPQVFKQNTNQQQWLQRQQHQLQQQGSNLNPANRMQRFPQQPQNIQVQTNATGQRMNQGRVQQRRIQQANIVITQKNEQIQPQRIVTLKQNVNAVKQIVNRRVALKGMNAVNSSEISQESQESGDLSSFLSNRKVISNSATITESSGVEFRQESLLETPIVVVSNLAAGTTDVKIRKLCQGLGPIQKIEMIPNSRQATIRFKNVVSAHKFFKKYQRKIVDLSMIHVSLEPDS